VVIFNGSDFLLSRPAKTLTLAQLVRMPDAEAEAMFRQVHWPETTGAPVCLHCGGLDAYEARREQVASFPLQTRRVRKGFHRYERDAVSFG
jgi:hypothetical protein